MTKTGLVLEGGAMRGLFTAGVLDVLMQNHITFDGAVGVSAGAAFGCNLKSHQIGRVLRYNISNCHNASYCSLRSLLFTGDLYGGKYCYETLPDRLDRFDTAAFAGNPMEFWCVCTDADTADPVYYRCTSGSREDLLYVRASASMPIVSRPVRAGGRKLLDGGIADSIPLQWMEKQGYDRIVVLLTQPPAYRKQPVSARQRAFYRAAMHGMPEVYRKILERPDNYNRTLEEIRRQEAAGRIFVIRPSAALQIGPVCHKAEELQRVYRQGIQDGEKILADLIAYLDGSYTEGENGNDIG